MSNDELLRRHDAGGRDRCAGAAAGLAAAPSLHTALLTCMDCRIDEQTLFGLEPGDVHVLRNAGGVVTDDVVRSLVISQRKLGTREVLLVAHTGCGMATFTDDEFSEELARETGLVPSWRPQSFADAATNVGRGITRLRTDPFLLPEMSVRGFVLDIETFTLTEVTPA
ncbi:carbonic anhydrase [Pseudonocardia sp. KRD291]|uniref:beta-class carbonic anhydrase n=1 Tax=Pseudonocardia sp. KRD291 TaxID=2792007 RepID=UPI001C4A5035|nr:carbonic anhydrase [Pseudonocardia sp. KRD291]MBW0104301.1 carbonic anhydrase [Pseudonocardia sp. KRD291]